MRKNINTFTIYGRVHSFGDNGKNMLALKVTGANSKAPGTEYISGIVNVATDEAGLNVIPVHFTYVTAIYAKTGKTNSNFQVLKDLINSTKTWVTSGKEQAALVKIDGSIGLNEFYVEENGAERLISQKINEGSFINILNALPSEDSMSEDKRAQFTTDMVITRTKLVEANEETNVAEHLVVSGAIFNFRNELKPLEYIVTNPQGIAYFSSLDFEDGPIYTKVWGKMNCSMDTKTFKDESAFGEDSVRVFERKVREWICTGCSRDGYEFGDETVMTTEELVQASQAREVYLAELKKRAEENKAARNAPTAASFTAPAVPTPKAGNFTF